MAEVPNPTLSLVYTERGQPRVFQIPEGTTTVGSARDNDLVLEDGSVSPHQIVLMRNGGTLELRDLFAGVTMVNSEARTSGQLSPGDVLILGDVKLRVLKAAHRPSGSQRVVRTNGQRPPTAAADAAERGTGTARLVRPSQALGAALAPGDEADPVTPSSDADFGRADESTESDRPALAHDYHGQPNQEEELKLREREARRARVLARARQLSDTIAQESDFDTSLEMLVNGLLDVFSADRGVAVLFEEDGHTPSFSVERVRAGSHGDAGIAEEIAERCIQVRTVLRVAGDREGLGGLASPIILSSGRLLGLLYFERSTAGDPIEADDVHLMAMLTNHAASALVTRL